MATLKGLDLLELQQRYFRQLVQLLRDNDTIIIEVWSIRNFNVVTYANRKLMMELQLDKEHLEPQLVMKILQFELLKNEYKRGENGLESEVDKMCHKSDKFPSNLRSAKDCTAAKAGDG